MWHLAQNFSHSKVDHAFSMRETLQSTKPLEPANNQLRVSARQYSFPNQPVG